MKIRCGLMKRAVLATTTLPAVLAGPLPAWAVQSHGGAEGLVSHQVGHTLFVFGMGFLLYRTYRSPMKIAGWQEFRFFVITLILWNVLTFSGHWMAEFVSPARYVKSGALTIAYRGDSFFDVLFYLTRLDHLLLVPAFLFLLLALRKWNSLP